MIAKDGPCQGPSTNADQYECFYVASKKSGRRALAIDEVGAVGRPVGVEQAVRGEERVTRGCLQDFCPITT